LGVEGAEGLNVSVGGMAGRGRMYPSGFVGYGICTMQVEPMTGLMVPRTRAGKGSGYFYPEALMDVGADHISSHIQGHLSVLQIPRVEFQGQKDPKCISLF
jgi:hypothetical protein